MRTSKHLSYFACRKDLALIMHKLAIVRFWGLTAKRDWARLTLDRLDALAPGSAATTHGGAAGHIDDAAEHYNFFYPYVTTGTAHRLQRRLRLARWWCMSSCDACFSVCFAAELV